jgi:hypothetical protein
MSTGGEVANALVCKTSIRGFNSRPVLQKINDLDVLIDLTVQEFCLLKLVLFGEPVADNRCAGRFSVAAKTSWLNKLSLSSSMQLSRAKGLDEFSLFNSWLDGLHILYSAISSIAWSRSFGWMGLDSISKSWP